MKTYLTSLAVAACVTLGAMSAQANDRRVNIINETSTDMIEFYASNIGTDDWEEDILGAYILEAGGSVVVNIDDGTGYCKFDFLGVFADGEEVLKRGVDVVRSLEKVEAFIRIRVKTDSDFTRIATRPENRSEP
jgi:hypothetical protein